MTTMIYDFLREARNAAKQSVERYFDEAWPRIEETILTALAKHQLTVLVKPGDYEEPARNRYFDELLAEKLIDQGLPSTRKFRIERYPDRDPGMVEISFDIY